MKQSHKYSLAAIATAAVVFNFSSCKEERDEDNIPFKSVRLAGAWDVVSIDGIPLDQDDYSMEMDFDVEGDLKYTYSYEYYGYTYEYSERGEWEWTNEKKSIRIDLGWTIDFFQVELKGDELSWMYYGERWELERI